MEEWGKIFGSIISAEFETEIEMFKSSVIERLEQDFAHNVDVVTAFTKGLSHVRKMNGENFKTSLFRLTKTYLQLLERGENDSPLLQFNHKLLVFHDEHSSSGASKPGRPKIGSKAKRTKNAHSLAASVAATRQPKGKHAL